MVFCQECGNSYPDEAKFCPHCGKPNALLTKSVTHRADERDNLRQKTDVSGAGRYGINVNNMPNGTTLEKGRYAILEKLGEGGFGVVYKATDTNYDGLFKALKVIYSENYSDRLVMHKLKTEAKNMISINHPNVVRLYDSHFEGEIKFLDMEFVDGGDLVDLMLASSDNKVAEKKVWELATQIAQGMQAIHSVNIIHQDLKPENILLTKAGDVKITDFGISETFRSSKSRIEESDVKGTFVYASPEQLIGKNVGKEADVWSFGATLYHLLNSNTLYSGITSNDIITQIERREFEPIPDASDKMNALLTKCLKRDYKQRFRDCGEIMKFIERKQISETKVNLKSKAKPKIEPKIEPKLIEKKINKQKYKPNPLLIDKFVFVEGGSFKMGSKDGRSNEKPIHKVIISDFYISKYPVTQGEWSEIMENNPSCFIGKDNPVENISWYDAVEFCNKKSLKEGLELVYSISNKKTICNFSRNGYRLPTEAEWEFAARGGNKSKGYKYSGSDTLAEVTEFKGSNDKSTKIVGSKKENELDIYDMSGNVWEWCWDWNGSYSSFVQTDPVGPSKGYYRVIRGGCRYYSATSCRVSDRYRYFPADGYYSLGFRLARSAK